MPGRLQRYRAEIVAEWMVTQDEVRLAVRRWEPATAGDTTVVLVHGFSASKDDPAVGAVGAALRDAGHAVLSYTARGHGESEGLCTLGDLEHLDVQAAVATARADADRVVLVGASMGAIAVLRHAADARTAGVVTVSSPAEWRVPRTLQSGAMALLTQSGLGRWLARRWMDVRLAQGWSGAAPPLELVAAIDAPVAVIHGTGDRFIKAAEAEKLYAAAGDPRRLDLVPDMGHAYMPESVAAIVAAVGWATGVDDARRSDRPADPVSPSG